MAELRFSEDHEWVRVEGGGIAVVGISDYAQEQLGDVVFVELPEPGRSFARGDEAAVVESVKAASEVYAPVTGEIVAVNGPLDEEPGLVNSAPTGEGWFFSIRMSDPSELDGLMDAAAYESYLGRF